MTKLIFATNNENKVKEIRSVIGRQFEVISLKEAGINIHIPEPYDTLEANASEKSHSIYRVTGLNCFSEDTGLETEALKGEPGVKSARYAGEGKTSKDNIEKLLAALEGIPNRNARFRTVISLIVDGKEYFFYGSCEGSISYTAKGKNGFGYDSIFIPLGASRTFAEMGLKEKNSYSHRQKAITNLATFLSQNGKKMFQ